MREFDAQHFGGPDDSIRWCGDSSVCHDVGDGAVILRATSPGEVRGARESLVERDACHRLFRLAGFRVRVERDALDGVLPVRGDVGAPAGLSVVGSTRTRMKSRRAVDV